VEVSTGHELPLLTLELLPRRRLAGAVLSPRGPEAGAALGLFSLYLAGGGLARRGGHPWLHRRVVESSAGPCSDGSSGKVLDGCTVNGRHWVLAAGLTNVEVALTVHDTATGAHWSYANPLGTAFPPVLDTAAFASCP